MRTDLFDFDLPPERIALRPLAPREAARLLGVRPGGRPEFEDRVVGDLPELLREGDQLVVNDTRVIAARLSGRRIGRAGEPAIEATLIKRPAGARRRGAGTVRPPGQTAPPGGARGEDGEATLAFAFHGPVLDQAIAERGEMPLPPYIAARRRPDERDRTDYQTVFARG